MAPTIDHHAFYHSLQPLIEGDEPETRGEATEENDTIFNDFVNETKRDGNWEEDRGEVIGAQRRIPAWKRPRICVHGTRVHISRKAFLKKMHLTKAHINVLTKGCRAVVKPRTLCCTFFDAQSTLWPRSSNFCRAGPRE